MLSSSRGASLVAAALMAAVAAVPVTNFAAPPSSSYGYGRYSRAEPGRRNKPAGTKLARKAQKGHIGIRKGW